MPIRPATFADLDAINAIYNHYVRTSTTTYQEDEDTLDARRAWFEAHDERHPMRVVEEAGEVIAWGSLNVFRPRSAYRFTTENSIFVRHDRLRRGIGEILLLDQIEAAKRLGHHVILAAIDSAQAGSIALHRKHGFVEAGRLREAGYKFNQWLNVVFMQRMISES